MNRDEIDLTPIGTSDDLVLTVYLTHEQLEHMLYCTEYVERIRGNSRKQYKNKKEREGKPPNKTYTKMVAPQFHEMKRTLLPARVAASNSISAQRQQYNSINVYHASYTSDCDDDKRDDHLSKCTRETCAECNDPFKIQKDGKLDKVAAHVIAKINNTYNMGLITTCKGCNNKESKIPFSVTSDNFTKIYTLDYWCRKNNKTKSDVTNR